MFCSKVPHIKKNRKDLPEWDDGVLSQRINMTLTDRQYRQIIRAAQFQDLSNSAFIRKTLWHVMNGENLYVTKDEVNNEQNIASFNNTAS